MHLSKCPSHIFFQLCLAKSDNIEGARFFKMLSWDSKGHIIFEMVFSKLDNIGRQSYVSKICVKALALDCFFLMVVSKLDNIEGAGANMI